MRENFRKIRERRESREISHVFEFVLGILPHQLLGLRHTQARNPLAEVHAMSLLEKA
jgi:hypothetical protein